MDKAQRPRISGTYDCRPTLCVFDPVSVCVRERQTDRSKERQREADRQIYRDSDRQLVCVCVGGGGGRGGGGFCPRFLRISILQVTSRVKILFGRKLAMTRRAGHSVLTAFIFRVGWGSTAFCSDNIYPQLLDPWHAHSASTQSPKNPFS